MVKFYIYIMSLVKHETVFLPNDLVQYGSGVVVSEHLTQSDEGNVTLFAFDKGQGLSEHSASDDAIVYMREGDAEFIIDGSLSRLAAGELSIIPAGIVHSVAAVTRCKMMIT